jgi:hypothetical protein
MQMPNSLLPAVCQYTVRDRDACIRQYKGLEYAMHYVIDLWTVLMCPFNIPVSLFQSEAFCQTMALWQTNTIDEPDGLHFKMNVLSCSAVL